MITEFSRTEMLIGPKALNALKGSCVVVFGAGGVGSHAIEALARSGIGHLILIDSDTVSLTNINRQSIAYHSTVGQYKTRVMADRIRAVSYTHLPLLPFPALWLSAATRVPWGAPSSASFLA